MRISFLTASLVVALFAVASLAADADKSASGDTASSAAAEGPPLPFHTIEGYGGGAITPMAYLVNPPKKGDWFGWPSAAFSNVIAGKKNLQAFTVTENLIGRIELGYGLDRLGLGTLPGDIKDATHVDIGTDDVWMQNFNVRGLLVEENSFGTSWLPAFTAGADFKVNNDIASINNKLGRALSNIGYDSPWGIDYTLTASKTLLDKWTLNRPLIVTGGLRLSEASNLGFLGFGDEYKATFEGSVAWRPILWPRCPAWKYMRYAASAGRWRWRRSRPCLRLRLRGRCGMRYWFVAAPARARRPPRSARPSASGSCDSAASGH